jgi:2-polyprenyl-6-methoxyphenol hydroxylase-like FAD-dependent oxidoreductase
MNDHPLHGVRVLVSGAGIAGPALAYWLSRYGAEVTVVEIAPALRRSGFAVDFRGPTHLGVLEKMGVLDELKAAATNGGAMSAVTEDGREIFRLPEAFAGGDVEVLRRDLSRVFFERTAGRAEYRFGDAITGLTPAGDQVRADFGAAASATYDLVIGTDGLHSAVRGLAFGPESQFVRHLGFYLAGWDLPNDLRAGPTPQQYNVPGRMASVRSDPGDPGRALAFAVFAGPRHDYDWHDTGLQKRIVADALGGMGWHVPRLLGALRDAPELYFDAICRVRAPGWTAGRVALLGDAAWGVTLGGMGVGTGVVGAYVLAGELARSGGDHLAGLAAYERRMRGYAGRWQRGANPGQFLAPTTATRLRLRNTMFANRLFQRLLVASTKSLATDAGLPDYPAASAVADF